MSRLAVAFTSGLIAAGVVATLVLAWIVAIALLDHEPSRPDNPSLQLEPKTGEAPVLPDLIAPDPPRRH